METFHKLFGSLLGFVYHCFDRIVIQGYLPLLESGRFLGESGGLLAPGSFGCGPKRWIPTPERVLPFLIEHPRPNL